MWILIELALMALIILGRIYLGWFGFALALVVFFAGTLPNLARRLARSRVVVKAHQDFSYIDVKCPHCTVGVQVLLNDEGWGPIPEHIRMAQKGSRIFHPRQANVRGCTQCSGKGFRPTKVIPGQSERDAIPWPLPNGELMSGETVYDEKPEA